MKWDQVELHNVSELLSGPSESILPEAAVTHIRDADPDGGLGNWGDIPARGSWITRVPEKVRRALNGPAQINAIQATGCELRFRLPPAGEAKIVLNSLHTPSIAEVWAGSFFRSWHVVGLDDTTISIKPPENLADLVSAADELGAVWDPTLVRVLLPWRPPSRIVSIEGDILPYEPSLVPETTYLAYGSSITHGNTSVRTSAMYASRVAQRLGYDLINLGFGGGAHLEPEIAEHIAGRTDFDIASFELGINLIGRIEVDEFESRIDRFIDIVVDAHPDKPLIFIDLFPSRYDYGTEEMRTRVAAFRKVVARKVKQVATDRILHLDGRELLSGADGLTSDLVHPSPAGMEQIASRLSAIMCTHDV